MVSAKVGVISKREYLAIAAVPNIDVEAYTAPLEKFDGLNVFVYYPSVLSNVVFFFPIPKQTVLKQGHCHN